MDRRAESLIDSFVEFAQEERIFSARGFGIIDKANAEAVANFIEEKCVDIFQIEEDVLEHLPPQTRNHRLVALAAVKCDGLSLKLFDDTIRDDEEIVRAAKLDYPEADKYASVRLQNLL